MSDKVKTISNPLPTAKRFPERLQLQGVEIKADVDFAKGHVPVAACEVVFEALPVQVSQTEDGGTLQPALRPRSTISKTRLGT